MSKPLSLTAWLSIAVITIASAMLASSLSHGIYQRYDAVNNQASNDIKREVARLARMAEKSFVIDSQLLFDDIAQQRTDPRVALAAVVGGDSKIVYATDFALRNHELKSKPEFFDAKMYQHVILTKVASVDVRGHYLLAYMGFSLPANNGELRGLQKGAIVLVYDLKIARDEILASVINEHIIEFAVGLLIATMGLMWLRHHIITPISKLENAAQSLSQGRFSNDIKLYGPLEVQNLTTAFNRMAEKIQHNIESIREQKEHIETIIDNIIDGIIIINEHGIVVSFSRPAENIFGYTASEVIGHDVKMLMPNPHRDSHNTYIKNYQETGEAKIIGKGREVQGLHKSGRTFPVDLGISVVERNKERLFIGIVRDISEKHKVERMKREFVSTVSHELRTPLTAITGAIALLESGALAQITGKATTLLSSAKRNSKRLLELINDLLDMDKAIEGKLVLNIHKVNLTTILQDSVDDNKSYADQYGVTIETVFDSKPIFVNGDETRLGQVMANLISNACKFSRENGVVEIGREMLTENRIRVYVRDHGEGIPDEFKQHIFAKFMQADSSDTRRKGGTGLGLAITKALIEQMGGYVGFESTQGQGTTFYFDLTEIVST